MLISISRHKQNKRELEIIGRQLNRLYAQLEDVPEVSGKVTRSSTDFPYIEEHVTVRMDEPRAATVIKDRIRGKEKRQKELMEEIRKTEESVAFLSEGIEKQIMEMVYLEGMNQSDAACMDIVSGAFDYNSVLRRVVTQLTNSGLRQIDYASGRANRIDVVARRAIMTGVSQITGKITDYNAEKLGADHFEVAWHSGARPTHAVWQGKVWTREQLVNVCGLGSATGLLGINCYHEYYPFFPGISERNWTDEWLEEKNRKENTSKTFNGKEYTLYEAKQRQRQMETCMRAQREKVELLKTGGADPDDVMLARAKYQGQLNEYSRFCKKMGLTEERERIYLDMRGRVAPSKAELKVAKNIMGTDNLFEKSKVVKMLGVDKKNVDFGKMDERSKKSVYNGIKKVYDKFPQLQGYTNKVLYDPNITGYAMSESLSGVLRISSEFSDYKELKRRYDRDVRMQFHPEGTDADAIIIHEMGHQLDGYLTRNGVWGGKISIYGTTRTSVAVKREVLQQLGYFDYIRSERVEWSRMGYKGRELNEALEFSKKEFITKHISEYANKNEREFFAECFSEYMTSKKPREAARIFGEVLKEIMEGLQ